jgi:putative flippase GtrA
MRKMMSNAIALAVEKKQTIAEAGKYFVVGGLCTLLDFLLLFVLTHFAGLHYIMSSVISFMSATALNYYLCTFWIFKVRTVENRNLEIFYYAIITAVGLGINSLLIYVLTSFVGFYFMLSKLMATFVTYWWNFGARKYFLHSKSQKNKFAVTTA